jgi:hypothetical protein
VERVVLLLIIPASPQVALAREALGDEAAHE